jgi:hypothetical protein
VLGGLDAVTASMYGEESAQLIHTRIWLYSVRPKQPGVNVWMESRSTRNSIRVKRNASSGMFGSLRPHKIDLSPSRDWRENASKLFLAIEIFACFCRRCGIGVGRI